FFSTGGEPVVTGRVAAHVAPELPRLHLQHASVTHLVAEFRVTDLGVETTKPRLPETTASAVVEHSAVGGTDEIAFVQFAAIDEADRDAVGDQRSKFLHQIQRERGTSVTRLMKKAQKRIEPHGVADAAEFLGQHRIAE